MLRSEDWWNNEFYTLFIIIIKAIVFCMAPKRGFRFHGAAKLSNEMPAAIGRTSRVVQSSIMAITGAARMWPLGNKSLFLMSANINWVPQERQRT